MKSGKPRIHSFPNQKRVAVELSDNHGTGRFLLGRCRIEPECLQSFQAAKETTETKSKRHPRLRGIAPVGPFHAQRLFRMPMDAGLRGGMLAGVLRSKGLMWNRHQKTRTGLMTGRRRGARSHGPSGILVGRRAGGRWPTGQETNRRDRGELHR